MEDNKVFVKDRYFVPISLVNRSKVKDFYEVKHPTKSLCRANCKFNNTPQVYCTTCPGKDAVVKLWNKVKTRKNTYIALPSGDTKLFKSVCRASPEIKDLRPIIPFKSDLRWTGKLYEGGLSKEGKPIADQRHMVNMWRKHVMKGNTGGLIISPPRTGKTVLGVRVSLGMRVRTFITASQIDFLRQFCRRYGKISNVRELYRQGIYPIVLVDPKGWPDGPSCGIKVVAKWGKETSKADIVLSSYQQFISEKGRDRLQRHLYDRFSLAVGDEIHQAASHCFSRLFNRINVRYKLGLTATINRKDHLEAVVGAIVGPATVVGKTVSMIPRIELLETGATSPRNYKAWAYLEKFLTENEVRNRLIVKQVFKDLRSSKAANILVPVRRVAHIHNLVKLINQQAAYNNKHRDEDLPTELAVAFKGGSDTNAILKQIDAGKARVTIGITKMVQHGLDVQRWTHVYIGVIPTSNTPLMYQLANRVCTPYDENTQRKLGDKPQPIVRFLIDQMNPSVFCFAKLFLDKELGIDVGLRGGATRDYRGNVSQSPVRYSASSQTIKRMAEIAKYPKSYSSKDVGVELSNAQDRRGRERKGKLNLPKKGIIRL